MNQEEQAMASISHVDIACNMGRLSQKQYSRPAQQLSRNGRRCRKARSGATMARGPHLFSPPVEPIFRSCQGNSNTKHLAKSMNGSPVSSKTPEAQADLALTKQGVKDVYRNDSTELESSDQDNITPCATFARKLQLSWTHYGSMPQRVFIHHDGRARNWDIGRLGYFNPWPSNFESQGKYWKPTLDHMSGLDDDRFFTAFFSRHL